MAGSKRKRTTAKGSHQKYVEGFNPSHSQSPIRGEEAGLKPSTYGSNDIGIGYQLIIGQIELYAV